MALRQPDERAVDLSRALEPPADPKDVLRTIPRSDPERPTSDYVRKLVAENAELERERAEASTGLWRDLNPVGITACELLTTLVLLEGIATVGRLTRETCLDKVAVTSYTLALQDAGLAFMHETKDQRGRRVTKVEITDAGRNVVG